MKKLLLGIGVGIGVVTALTLSPVIDFEPVERTSASEEASCPSGSYLIGYDKDGVNPICKLEPTGCPFGDSVPLDKCTPPPDIICNEDWTKCEPKKENEGNNVESNSEVRNTRSTSGQEEQPSGCYGSK